jgi:hypothetical protein
LAWQGLIDPEAVYFAQILPRINEKGVYKITGPFPPVRYFSFQVRHNTIHLASHIAAAEENLW